MPRTTWIVLADASRATIYATDHDLHLRPVVVETLENPNGRARAQELVTDHVGRSHDLGPRQMAPGASPHEVEVRNFAHSLAEWLRMACTRGDFEELIVSSPPQFLGLLRGELCKGVRAQLRAAVNRGFGHLDEHEVLEAIQAHLA